MLKKGLTFAADLLVKLAFLGIAAYLTPLIIKGPIDSLVYVWLVSIITLLVLMVKDLRAYIARPFSKRYCNEEDAMPAIQEMVTHTQKDLCVLSKVGTSVFFGFRAYSQLLENERTIQVLMADPDDASLISLMDRIYVHQKTVANRWARMVSQIQLEVDALYGDGAFPQTTYEVLKEILVTDGGYRNVIAASIYMWTIAQDMANERLRLAGKPIKVHGLDIRVYNVLPDIKAWIVDSRSCALGHYDAIHLGRDNPVDIYRPGRLHHTERWQLDNVLAVWRFKFEKSRQPDILALVANIRKEIRTRLERDGREPV